METFSKYLWMINSVVILIAIPLLTFLGAQKFFIEPLLEARSSRRKFATGLYMACQELSNHLASTVDLLSSSESAGIADAMKNIPDDDFNENPAWFTKDGYYTTITAYKIASVSAWIRVYQNALLFSSYPANQSFLKDLYERAQNLKLAFSGGTCLWYYYFDAIGERLIEDNGKATSLQTFGAFCNLYAVDKNFRLFFEQVHMYIWFLADRRADYLDTIPRIQKCLLDLISFLEAQNLLRGFQVQRRKAAVSELEAVHKIERRS